MSRTLPVAKLRAFVRILQRPRRVPFVGYSRVVGVADLNSGTVTWLPNEPWEGPIKGITVEEFLRHEPKRTTP